MKIPRRRRNKPGLELTPLVDVVFLLLTFYMLTSTFIREEGVPLELPQSSSAEASGRTKLTLSLLSETMIQVDSERVPFTELQQYLQKRLKPETNILVRSGKGNRVQALLTVLDEVRAAGGRNVTLATSRKE